jgi:hypothetical protein
MNCDSNFTFVAAVTVQTRDVPGLGRAWRCATLVPRTVTAGDDELDEKLWQAVDGVTHWPDHDLFGQFP